MPELRLASLLDAACDAVLVVAADGDVLYCNRAGEKLFGRTSEQIVGRNVRMLFATDRHGSGETWATYIGGAGERPAVLVSGRDGREIPADLVVSTSPTSATPQHLVVVRPRVASDEHAPADEHDAELTRAARVSAAEDVGNAIAHKLNQPLTAVILYLQAIERAYERETGGSPLPETVASILRKAVHEAERASSMLQSVRHVRGGDGGRPQLSDINEAVEDAIDLTGLRARRGASINRLLTPRLPPVPIDRAELQQALMSLIRGALDAARDQRLDGIRLTTDCARGHVAVVAETTAGEGGEIVDNCALSTNGRGNCERELAVARAIARSHGGDVVVDADGRGRGARFTLQLPLPAGTASSA